MSDFRPLSDRVYASPQIAPEDIAEARRLGVGMIINNRPDFEAPDQPPGAEIERVAAEAGIAYRAVPIDHSGFSDAKVGAMTEALEAAQGKVLAYCRSGTRSTYAWALARASRGEEPSTLVEAAARAGYDLRPIEETLRRLADRTGD